MSADFKKALDAAEAYEFEPELLDAVPIDGYMRKSADRNHFIVVISTSEQGDVTVELAVDDVVKHQHIKGGTCCADSDDQLTRVFVKPSAAVTTRFTGKASNARDMAKLITLLGPPWRDLISPFSALDIVINSVNRLAWNECRARARRECRALHPNDDDAYERCLTPRLVECGPPPRLRVGERTLEKLADLFREPIFEPIDPPDFR